MTTPDILIWIVPEKLSDGSIVYNVKLPDDSLSAYTSEDATELAAKIVDAINEHTTNIADVME